MCNENNIDEFEYFDLSEVLEDEVNEFDNNLDREDKVKKAEKTNYDKAEERAKCILQKNLKIHNQKIKNIEEILAPPKPFEQYRIKAIKSFNAMTFILYIIKHFKTIENILITTYNMNEKTMRTLFYLFENGIIKNISIVISESISFRMPKRVEQLEKLYEKYKYTKRIKIALIWNHSKIACIKTGYNYFVIEGSGNYSDNAEIEQYLFENNKKMYDENIQYFNKEAFEKEKSKRHKIFK